LMVGGSVGPLAGLAQEYEDRNQQNALHRLERLDPQFRHNHGRTGCANSYPARAEV
jgi:hypothetical protein